MANERSSGTAFFSSKDEKSVLAGAHDYFVNNVLPSDIKACVRKIKAPTLYVNNHDETFLLVRAAMVHSRSTVWITASSRTRLSTSGRFTATAISRTRGRRLRSPRAA